MFWRAAKFYLGIWIPTAVSWIVVVLIAAIGRDVALGTGLLWAIFGPLAAILLGAYSSREDKRSTIGFVATHLQMTESSLLRAGLKKGLILGPVSVLGVAIFASIPFLLDRILTMMGK